MQIQNANIYDFHPAVAVLYDEYFNEQDDVEFLYRLIGERTGWHILEPFCGTGRILLAFAGKGHFVFGIDHSEHFLQRLQYKSYLLLEENRHKVETRLADALHTSWSSQMDLVILGSNCFYELPTPETQEVCLHKAYNSLRSGGFVYVDNDHMEGSLSESWQNYKVCETFPTGCTRDNYDLKTTRQAVWFDVGKRQIRYKRKTIITDPKGKVHEVKFIQQKHPVSKLEVEKWLVETGFSILKVYGDYEGNIYNKNSPRAIFWAQKV